MNGTQSIKAILRVATIASLFAVVISSTAIRPSLAENEYILLCATDAHRSATGQNASNPQTGQRLTIIILDENGVVVPSARVTLTHVETQTAFKGETDYAGRREFAGLAPGLYTLRVEKEGFYAVVLSDVQVGEASEAASMEITLNHQQEFAEEIDVVYSSPAIDPAKTATSETLSGIEIINIPYPTTRDVRNVLPFIPGVVQDNAGQVHINGSASHQIFDLLDGFNITHPVSGLMELRVSADALRSIEVIGSRYSAEYGKGSGGVLNLATGMGDDRYRFSATNFIPSFQTNKGVNLDNWTPRATLSGPLRKKKAWFFEAADAEYNIDIIDELPEGADRNHSWRIGSLTKAQVNLNQSNIFTAGFLVNRFGADHAGVSRFNPVETTLDLSRSAYLFTLKEQSYFSNGALAEIGFGINQFRNEDRPMGTLPYVISPEGTSGNFFKSSEGRARRYQWVASLIVPPADWHGRHEFKFGADLDRVTYDQFTERRMITILRGDGTRAREVVFSENARFRKNNFEASGFAQDRWSLTNRSIVELGIRLDWDQIIRRASLSPRLAFSHLLTKDGDTKIAAGVGLIYDATNLNFVTRPLNGQRADFFYLEDGMTPDGPPVETMFLINEQDLRSPRSFNWSVGLDRKLPASIYMKVEFVQKRGRNGLAFVNVPVGAGQSENVFELGNARRDRYDSLQITMRRAFAGGYGLMASYTRSSARSNTVFEFDIDNPLFSQQAGGRLAWDTPNRFISWGWLPLLRGFDFAYSAEWRDGYPFSIVDEDQQLVGPPNSRRLPDHFSLNTHIEKRFHFMGFRWGLRAGFNNITNRDNPTGVNNNIDSPQFLTFGGLQHRTFTGRIRFLGRK